MIKKAEPCTERMKSRISVLVTVLYTDTESFRQAIHIYPMYTHKDIWPYIWPMYSQ